MTDKSRYNPAIHHRRSIRLQGYDYSQAGAYFITICTHNRECLFGKITDGRMKINDAGRMIQSVWEDMPPRFDGVELDTFNVMPNHIHGIMVLTPRRGESCIRPSYNHIRPSPVKRPNHCPSDEHSINDGTGDHMADHKGGDHKDRPYGTLPGTVGRIIQAFKSITTHQYTVGAKKLGWPSFQGKLWQRNYWEHIVRNETELNRIREYIINNPAQWESDKLYCRPSDHPCKISEPVADYGSEAWMV
jgi:putative transposase